MITDSIKEKLTQLAHRLLAIKNENAALQAENEHLRKREAMLMNRVEELELNALTLHQTIPENNGDSSPTLKEELNQIIKEIDECIAHYKE